MKKLLLTGAVASVAIAAAVAALSTGSGNATEVMLYKNPQCGCCEGYADYLRDNGFEVTVKATHDLSMMSREAGIPGEFEGCHLSYVEDYVVSGHVPIATLKRLLAERPEIKGITLPGMPQGSPGMSGTKSGPFVTYEVGPGRPKVYDRE